MHITQLVANLNWKTLLFKAVREGKLDPWDIDIAALAKEYLKQIRAAGANLAESGKIVLAAAILLWLKSKSLFGKAARKSVQQPALYLEPEELLPRAPVCVRRKISLYELVRAFEHALEVGQRKAARLRVLPLILPKPAEGIDTLIAELRARLKSLPVLFSALVAEKELAVRLFIALLYLVQRGEVEIRQARPFGEIEIWQG